MDTHCRFICRFDLAVGMPGSELQRFQFKVGPNDAEIQRDPSRSAVIDDVGPMWNSFVTE